MADFNYQLYNDDEPAYLLETSRKNRRPVPNFDRFESLDVFLTKVYNYHLGKGFRDIALTKILNLLTLTWVAVVVGFLTCWVDYDVLLKEGTAQNAIQFQGLPPILLVATTVFGLFILWALKQLYTDLRDNWSIKRFYREKLYIDDNELAIMEWRDVAKKLVKVPNLCVYKENMTVLDVANRIMRKENYLIAMINKDILKLSVPLPGLKNRFMVTKTIEWSLVHGLFSFMFDPSFPEVVNPQMKDPSKHAQLVKELRNRFRWMGLFALLLSPFTFVFLLIYFVFQYGEELRNKPASFAIHQWSPLARWRFRELNELSHVFQRRLNASFPLAEKYVNSFPDNTLAIVARFISFVIGSLVIILVALGLWNDDFFTVDLFMGKSPLWFLPILGTIIAICRSVIPDENALFEPEKVMEEIVQHTHYMPKSWRNRLHTPEVLQEFSTLFDFKIIVFLMELSSVLFAPFILLFSLPNCADRIIQFVREFTVHEEGVGDVCKFAVFPLEENGNRKYGVESNSTKRVQTKNGKMEKSFLNFKANYPEWQPNSKVGEKYLSHLDSKIGDSYLEVKHSQNEDESDLGRSSFSRQRQELNESIMSLNKIHRQFFREASDSKIL
eukprot:TRINITY_DN39_c0_g1_i1.p1 TRINITY_DN39_c0_g1~~TRINITY_DN39_c0_g1_i1.p1  ORF type:complete len:632 (+),score=154.63 TRINITY_DN39_c0_g1_i1:63-1898(+)